ncbi:MAG: NAD-dependent epimerase/dehydratase family protein [Actinomycetota bacterium]
MRVLISGGAGFIGGALSKALLERGDDVVILDSFKAPVHGPDEKDPEGVTVIRGDVSSKTDWQYALDGVEAVAHFAAYQDYLRDFSTFFNINAAGTALLYEVIVERSLPIRRIVVASSQAVYGEGAYRCEADEVVVPHPRPLERLERGEYEQRCPQCGGPIEPIPTAETLGDPHSPYGISKLAQEKIALALGDSYGIPTVAMRYSIVHGPGQSPRNAYSGLLRSAALNMLAGVPPVAFEDGRQQRDYVSIYDVTRANLIALDHPEAPGKAFNVGGGTSWSVLDVIDALHEITGIEVEPQIPGIFRVGDTRHIVSDITALRSLGWEPSADMDEAWRAYWEWLQSLHIDPGIARRAFHEMMESGVLKHSQT